MNRKDSQIERSQAGCLCHLCHERKGKKMSEQQRLVHKGIARWMEGNCRGCDRKIQPMHLQLIWQWLGSELHQVLGSQSI